jgi:polar amino acid transport system substrate-binding protein
MVAAAVIAVMALSGCSAQSSGSSSDSNKLNLITPGTLRVGVTAASKPFVYQDNSGNWIGFEPDLVKNVAKRAGITKIEYVSQDFSTLLAAVANRKYDIAAACIGRTPERLKTVDYVKDYNNGYLIFIAKTSAGIKSAADLKGKRVGLITGSVENTYMTEKLPDAEVVGFPDSNTAVQSLLSGSVDAAFVDTDPAGQYVKQYPQLSEAFKVTSTAPCAWPISKQDTALKAALNKGMNAAIQDGTVEKLTKKWLPDSPILPAYKPSK